jgi:hypothetical protein
VSKRQQQAFLVAFLAAAAVVAGCGTMNIAMTPAPPSEQIGDQRLPIVVGLYFDDAFQNYHWQASGKGDLADRDFDLGAASKSLFLETFTLLTRSVALVNGKPPDPAVLRSGAALVIWPRITGFAPDQSAVLGVGDYSASITYSVTAYDRKGNEVLNKDYVGRGTASGEAKTTPTRIQAVAPERAMTNAMAQLVEDIKKLNLSGLP